MEISRPESCNLTGRSKSLPRIGFSGLGLRLGLQLFPGVAKRFGKLSCPVLGGKGASPRMAKTAQPP